MSKYLIFAQLASCSHQMINKNKINTKFLNLQQQKIIKRSELKETTTTKIICIQKDNL